VDVPFLEAKQWLMNERKALEKNENENMFKATKVKDFYQMSHSTSKHTNETQDFGQTLLLTS
jgi:hypothetical protein